jgi:hypothetical protein
MSEVSLITCEFPVFKQVGTLVSQICSALRDHRITESSKVDSDRTCSNNKVKS